MTNLSPAASGWKPSLVFLGFGAIAAAVASMAAFTSLHLGFAPWAMFVGWVAYFTRPISARQGAYTWLCLLSGLVLGVGAVVALRSLMPAMGSFALPVVVFVVTMIVVSMRAVRALDKIPAWFLGLIAFFAAHVEPSLSAICRTVRRRRPWVGSSLDFAATTGPYWGALERVTIATGKASRPPDAIGGLLVKVLSLRLKNTGNRVVTPLPRHLNWGWRTERRGISSIPRQHGLIKWGDMDQAAVIVVRFAEELSDSRIGKA